MILSKRLVQNKNVLLSVFKYNTTAHASYHVLRTSPLNRYSIILEPCMKQLQVRLESTHASIGKDKILNIPKETVKPATSAPPVEATPGTTTGAPVTDTLPDIPVPGVSSNVAEVLTSVKDLPDIIKDAPIPLNALGEPTLQYYGCGSYYTPVGWIQNLLDFVHVNLNLPWWASIAICVLGFRLLLFPLVIKVQRQAVRMNNVMPEVAKIQDELHIARSSGNQIEAMKATHKLAIFMKENKVNPVRSMILPIVQAPIFISFFFGLRRMAAVPIESMTTGGTLWFIDLTLSDQFYLLPLITSITFWGVMELSMETAGLPGRTNMVKYMGYAKKVIPVIMFPFMMGFPTAVCVYWSATNFVTLGQVLFLKIPAVRKYFQIELKKKAELPKTKGGSIITDVKSSFSNMRLSRELADRERLDQMAFTRAGKLPPAKTFKYNPKEKPAPQEEVKKKSAV